MIKDAGQLGAVTIATNMAGRGVDIKLGDGVTEVGGLYVLGTERHESRRIDNQLRGRSGRQGDPGETRFYLSAEDELIRLFAGDRMYKVLNRLGPGEGEALEHKMLTQRRREGAEEGRRAQLPAPQERAQVRRGDERAAPRHLRAAAPHPRGRGVRRAGARDGRRSRRRRGRGAHVRQPVRRGLGSRGALRRSAGRCTHRGSSVRDIDLATVVAADVERPGRSTTSWRSTTSASSSSAPSRCAPSSEPSCCRSSTPAGRNTCSTWTTCRRASTCGRSGSATRWPSTGREGFDLFQDMLGGVKQSVVTTIMKNAPEDLAMFAAMTFDQPTLALNYSSGEDLAYETSFAARRRRGWRRRGGRLRVGAAAGRRGAHFSDRSARRPRRSPRRRRRSPRWGATSRVPADRGRSTRSCHGA